jgi:hypothetical protein
MKPIDLPSVKRRLELYVLEKIQQHTATMSRLSVHHGILMSWRRKDYISLEFSLASAIASLRSSTHFMNVGRLRRVGASGKVERSERKCSNCVSEVEDERHTLLRCPVFEVMRSKWMEKLAEVGVVVADEDGLLRLCLDPSGKKDAIMCTAIFVRDVLKAIRKRYYGN